MYQKKKKIFWAKKGHTLSNTFCLWVEMSSRKCTLVVWRKIKTKTKKEENKEERLSSLFDILGSIFLMLMLKSAWHPLIFNKQWLKWNRRVLNPFQDYRCKTLHNPGFLSHFFCPHFLVIVQCIKRGNTLSRKFSLATSSSQSAD